MNVACEMHPAPRQASYPYEQQIPSTSFASSCAIRSMHPQNPAAYVGQPSGYMTPRMTYPHDAAAIPGTPIPPNVQPHFPVRPPIDSRKIANTQTWMSDHYRFSHVTQQNSRPGSAPSSVISGITQLSGMTNEVSLLSVNTQMTEAQNLSELKNVPASSAPSSASSCAENIDPAYVRDVESMMDIIIENMTTTDKGMQRKIVSTIYNLQLKNHFLRAPEVKLYKMICPMISWLSRADTEPDIVAMLFRTISTLVLGPRTREIFKQLTTEHPTQMLATFSSRLDASQGYCKHALITIHSLLEIAVKSKYNKEDITNRVLEIMRMMEEHGDRYFINTYKSKQCVFDVLRLVFYKDSNIKSHFASKGGIKMLLNFLRRETIECVAYRNVRVLTSIVSSEDPTFGKKFVHHDGIQIVARIFTAPHCSERLAKQCMWCLRAVSDLPIVQSVDLRDALNQIIPIVNATISDIDFLNCTIDFLGNVAASKEEVINVNKDFIAECGGIERTINVLIAFEPRRAEERVPELISSLIWALNIFTRSLSTTERNLHAMKKLIYSTNGPELLLYELVKPIDVKSQLTIINLFLRIVDADPLNHPTVLFTATAENKELTDILFGTIITLANSIEPNIKSFSIKKMVINKAFTLLISLGNCNSDFTAAIRYALCNVYRMSDVLLGTQDNDIIKATLDFMIFMIKDETIRESFSKDFTLVEAVRTISTQQHEYSSTAQLLLVNFTGESEAIGINSFMML